MARPDHPCSGERVWSAKLTEDQVREIRTRYAESGISQYELGREFGVAQTTVSAIVRFVNWKDDVEEQ